MTADTLNDRVIPFYERHGISLLRILADCCTREHHEYELYLALEDIDHTTARAKSPQTNGIRERFHRTVQNEFYAIAFRKKIYTTLEDLQADLDNWVEEYNTQRPYTGKYCYGKTLMQTFLDSLHLAKEKMLSDKYDDQNNDNHLSGLATKERSVEISARPDDTSEIKNLSSVHYSLAEIETDAKFAKTVNG